VLAVLLVLGAAGLATVGYGFEALLSGQLLGFLAIATGAFGAFLAFLFTAGILYRVDRYRGATHRRVELFE
jgi:hypothetical protein